MADLKHTIKGKAVQASLISKINIKIHTYKKKRLTYVIIFKRSSVPENSGHNKGCLPELFKF